MNRSNWTRRDFLKTGSVLSGAGLTLGGSQWLQGCSGRGHQTLRILFFTDVHAVEKFQVSDALKLAVDRIAESPVDLIIGGGDYIHGGYLYGETLAEKRFEVFAKFLDALRSTGKPVQLMLGNHDQAAVAPKDGSYVSDDPTLLFRQVSGLEKKDFVRSFNIKGHHLMILDSVQFTPGGNKVYVGEIDPDQLQWIKEDLGQVGPQTPIILCSHIPLRTTFMQKVTGATAPLPPNLIVQNANEVLDCFKDHNLRGVLQGHLHVNEWIQWSGMSFIMGGALCGAWWSGPNFRSEEGYGILRSDAGELGWEYVDYGWKATRVAKGKPWEIDEE